MDEKIKSIILANAGEDEFDRGENLNEIDKVFFKIAGFVGIFFFFLNIIFTYMLIFGNRITNGSDIKLVFYFFSFTILELIILYKSNKMFTLIRKRKSDYITGFFLIFFPLFSLLIFSKLLQIMGFLLSS